MRTKVSFDGEVHILQEGDSIEIIKCHTPIEIKCVSAEEAQAAIDQGLTFKECTDTPHDHTSKIKNQECQHPELRPAWTLETSNIASPPTIRVWIRNPPPGMLTELEELLKKYIPE